MNKVFLAVGHRQVEEFIQNKLKGQFVFVGTTVYREGILKGVAQNDADIVVIRETLEGTQNITDIIYDLRTTRPNARIVFIAGKREPGDALLSALVSYGIYDILTGDKINVLDIINLIKKPNKFGDVSHYQPKAIVDEKTNQKIFDLPTKVIEKVIEKEIYVDKTEEPKQSIPIINSTEEKIKNKKNIKDIKPEIKNEVKPTEVKEKQKIPLKPDIQISKKQEPSKKLQNTKKEVKKVEEVSQKRYLPFNRKEPEVIPKSIKQKIITFVGSKHGVGNSQLAFNTALKLSKNFKTIYIELDDNGSSIDYIFQLGEFDRGIDKALKGIEEGNYEAVEKSILSTENIVAKTSRDNLMLRNYKKFPKKLDYMFFSQEYVTKNNKREKMDFNLIKDLCIYLMIEKGYDFIVLDAKSDIYNKMTEIALKYGTKIFMTITQDVSTIGSSIAKLSSFNKNRINTKDKLYYIVNKFENAELSQKDIAEWIQSEVSVLFPNLNKEFINANYVGLPILLYSKNKSFHEAFKQIEKIIFQ